MASTQTSLSKETLKNRSQLTTLETTIKEVNIDSRVMCKLVSLGSNPSQTKNFAKLYGYMDSSTNQVFVKECIALPMISEGEKKLSDKAENQEKSILNVLGMDYNLIGIFFKSDNEDCFGEDLTFYLSHFNVFEGFCISLIYSKEAAKTSTSNPLKAITMSKELSEVYEYKTEKEIFEPNLKLLEQMAAQRTPMFQELTLKVLVSPVMELIVAKNETQLRQKNELIHHGNFHSQVMSNLSESMDNCVTELLEVLGNKKNLEKKKQHLLNMNGALYTGEALVKRKRDKLQEDNQKLSNLESLANS